jgi:hypothetical protein
MARGRRAVAAPGGHLALQPLVGLRLPAARNGVHGKQKEDSSFLNIGCCQ